MDNSYSKLCVILFNASRISYRTANTLMQYFVISICGWMMNSLVHERNSLCSWSWPLLRKLILFRKRRWGKRIIDISFLDSRVHLIWRTSRLAFPTRNHAWTTAFDHTLFITKKKTDGTLSITSALAFTAVWTALPFFPWFLIVHLLSL